MEDIPNVKMDTRNMSTEEIQDLFHESFDKTVAYENEIGEFEAICERAPQSEEVHVLVNITGFAGTPTVEQFGQCKGVNEVMIGREDKGRLKFALDSSMTTPLGGIDYQVVYKSQ